MKGSGPEPVAEQENRNQKSTMQWKGANRLNTRVFFKPPLSQQPHAATNPFISDPGWGLCWKQRSQTDQTAALTEPVIGNSRVSGSPAKLCCTFQFSAQLSEI